MRAGTAGCTHRFEPSGMDWLHCLPQDDGGKHLLYVRAVPLPTGAASGEAGFSFPGGGGGVDRALRPDPPQTGPPKSYRD